jgi:hypothetical protein
MPLSFFQRTNYRMMRLMARVMPSCRDIAALISQGMDEAHPLRKRLSIRLHVAMCSWCRRYERQLRLLREGARRYADAEQNQAGPCLSPEAKERLRAVLHREER